MKTRWSLLLGAVLLLALIALPGATAQAANVPCTVNPASGPVGTVFTVTCQGFAPNTTGYAWATEPDGTAWGIGPVTINSAGIGTVVFGSKVDSLASINLGTWAITIEQGGSDGIGRFTVTGGTEGVAGAVMSANPGTITNKGATIITGMGFAPGEIVSVWEDFPPGGCSGMTLHAGGGRFPVQDTLLPVGPAMGWGTVIFGNFKATDAGTLGFVWSPSMGSFGAQCLGLYHIVGRGNSSGRGAEAWVQVNGKSVTETAVLTANPSSVVALFGHIAFSGMGFGPGEFVNCWLTSPEGAVIVYLPNAHFRADDAGTFGFTMTTGTNVVMSGVPGGGFSSEGALGEWAMTCRGVDSGRLGIARFTVFGNAVDP